MKETSLEVFSYIVVGMDLIKLDETLLKKHRGISFVGVTTCFVCHDNNGRIFMAKRSALTRDEHGRWDVGGGGLDWGLTAEENAIKEIKEEYSATPTEVTFLGYRDVFRELPDGRPTHWLALDFVARVDPEQTIINETDKFEESGWFSMDNLPTPLHSQIPNMFKANEKQLREILSKSL